MKSLYKQLWDENKSWVDPLLSWLSPLLTPARTGAELNARLVKGSHKRWCIVPLLRLLCERYTRVNHRFMGSLAFWSGRCNLNLPQRDGNRRMCSTHKDYISRLSTRGVGVASALYNQIRFQILHIKKFDYKSTPRLWNESYSLTINQPHNKHFCLNNLNFYFPNVLRLTYIIAA